MFLIKSEEQVYEDAWKDIESILNNAEDFAYVEAPKEIEKVKTESSKPSAVKSNASFVVPPQPNTFVSGFCIGTHVK
ncbi:hypothetical protein Barb4_03103 [Bacteroidales bacterium Barb4]|nr:hypothetical protein Barb4_03103 [Bacteroidales bacterium Barb4]